MAKTAQSPFAKKLGSAGKTAFNEHKTDETEYGRGGDLPAGIEGGIAQITICKFDTYKKGDQEGEYYFLAQGTVVSPETHETQRVKGLRTMIMEPMCETPGRSRESVEEHLAWVLNELRKLGLDTSELAYEDLETAVATLQEEAPYFSFRTWKGDPSDEYPNPRTNHTWAGVVEGYEGDEDGAYDEVEDNTEEQEEEEQTEGEEESGGEEEVSLTDLGDLADGGDEDAGSKLTELAQEAGIDPNEYETWVEVASALQDEGGDSESGGEEEEINPEKGEVYYYRPPKAESKVEVEVTAVFNGKKTCNLKNLDSNDLYKSVSWEKLSNEA